MVPKGQVEGHKKENYFYICIVERIFQNETSGQFQSNLVQKYLHDRNSNEGPSPLQRRGGGVITKVQK